MKDEFSTNDPFLATIFDYNGCPCIKVTGSTNQEVQWTFRVKAMDARVIQEEFAANIAVYVNDWIKALKHVQGLQRTCKGLGGVWIGEGYVSGLPSQPTNNSRVTREP
jgi:hypothetical protein